MDTGHDEAHESPPRIGVEEGGSNAPAYVYPIASILDPIPVGELFPLRQPVELELGSGDGSFLVDYARRHAELNLLGVERLLGRLRKIEKKTRRGGLINVRLLRIEAEYLVRYLVPLQSVQAVHIYFPDPWPKYRHRDNRLIKPGFGEVIRRILKPRGRVFLRTDDAKYHAQMIEVMGAAPGFRPIETDEELRMLRTDFEREFNARGIPTLYGAFELA